MPPIMALTDSGLCMPDKITQFISERRCRFQKYQQWEYFRQVEET
jgi:hypothetical protein